MSDFVVETAPLLPAGEILSRLSVLPGAYLLESCGGHPLSRFVLAGAMPTSTLRVVGKEARHVGPFGTRSGDPWSALAELSGQANFGAPPWPRAAAIGCLAYELGALCDRFPAGATQGPFPLAIFQTYDAGYVHDLRQDATWVWGKTRAAARALLSALSSVGQLPARALRLSPFEEGTREEYRRGVRRVLDYIGAGDIYQANISRRFHARIDAPAHLLYRSLRAQCPAPFGGFLDFDEFQLLSVSPERFLFLDRGAGRIETRPIKGTRARSPHPARDRALAAELCVSAKDRAEHVMIVDLERNDLGRVCRTGSVRVARLAGLESFAHVHHLVSTVEGRLRPGVDLPAVLRATFPGGSITGAPKLRAMEIISEVEGAPRGPAFGAFGYIDAHGRVDLALAIRTAVVADGVVSYRAGGGIVADSDPDAEYEEASLKAASFLNAAAEPLSCGSAHLV
jgi:para-aminobenzoate synthetase component 1